MSTIVKEQTKPQKYLPYVAVLLALSAPLIQIALRPFLETTIPFPLNRFLSLWVFWIVAGVVLFYSVRIEGIPLSTFGIGRNKKSLRYRLIEMIIALLAGLVVTVVAIVLSYGVRDLLGAPAASTNIDLENIIPFWVSLPAWITAAFMEEVLFRSYPIERLTLLTGRRWFAAFISGALFVVLHIFAWDLIHLITMGIPVTLLITLLYLWRRSLWFVVIIHATIDIPILFLPFIAPYI